MARIRACCLAVIVAPAAGLAPPLALPQAAPPLRSPALPSYSSGHAQVQFGSQGAVPLEISTEMNAPRLSGQPLFGAAQSDGKSAETRLRDVLSSTSATIYRESDALGSPGFASSEPSPGGGLDLVEEAKPHRTLNFLSASTSSPLNTQSMALGAFLIIGFSAILVAASKCWRPSALKNVREVEMNTVALRGSGFLNSFGGPKVAVAAATGEEAEASSVHVPAGQPGATKPLGRIGAYCLAVIGAALAVHGTRTKLPSLQLPMRMMQPPPKVSGPGARTAARPMLSGATLRPPQRGSRMSVGQGPPAIATVAEPFLGTSTPARPNELDLEMLHRSCFGARPTGISRALERVEEARDVALKIGIAPRIPRDVVDGRFQVVYADARGWCDDQSPHVITMDFEAEQMRLSNPIFADPNDGGFVRQLWLLLHPETIGDNLKYDVESSTLSWEREGKETTWRVFYVDDGFIGIHSSDTGYNLVRRVSAELEFQLRP